MPEEKAVTIKLPKMSPWMLVTLVLAIALVVVLVTGWNLTGMYASTSTNNALTPEQAAENAMLFINNYLVKTGSVSFESVKEQSGLYLINTTYQGQEIPVYITKDGKFLILSQGIVNIEEFSKQMEEQQSQQPQTQQPQEIPKTDKPKVELFLMSFCPFGNRAENTMLPVYNLLKDKVDWEINYIVRVSGNNVNSLHGQPEVDQDERESCVLSEYGLDKWWKFTVYVNNNCGSNGDCWEEAANQAGLDTNKINNCVRERGLDLMKASESATNEAGATGSPTLIINGVKSRTVYQYENPEAYKQAICEAFVSPPEECSEVLEGSGTSTGGQC